MLRISAAPVYSVPVKPRFAANRRGNSELPPVIPVKKRFSPLKTLAFALFTIIAGACGLGQQDQIPMLENGQKVDPVDRRGNPLLPEEMEEVNDLLNQIPSGKLEEIVQKAYANSYELWEAGFATNPKDKNHPLFYLITFPKGSLKEGESLPSLSPASLKYIRENIKDESPDLLKQPPRVFCGPLNDIRQLTVTNISTCRCPSPIDIDVENPETEEKMTLSLPPFPDSVAYPRLIYREDAKSSVFSYLKPHKLQAPTKPQN